MNFLFRGYPLLTRHLESVQYMSTPDCLVSPFSEQQMAKRIKTLERPQRNMKLSRTPAVGNAMTQSLLLTRFYLELELVLCSSFNVFSACLVSANGTRASTKAPLNSAYNSSSRAHSGSNRDADHTATNGEKSSVRQASGAHSVGADASSYRKRGRGTDFNAAKNYAASGKDGIHSRLVLMKTTNGHQQTFNFAAHRGRSAMTRQCRSWGETWYIWCI